jgi:hypothetical protein
MAKYGLPGTPFYYLGRYRTTQRPRRCRRCGQNAYYYHDDWDWVCAAHLLDLVNIGEEAFSWDDYPEVWARTERLLKRPPLSTSVESMELVQENPAVEMVDPWDGI